MCVLGAGVVADTVAKGHSGEVTGIAVDGMNGSVVSVGTDGWLRVWGFASHAPEAAVDIGSPITQLELSKETGALMRRDGQ
jgi:hypothetical protein